ncbi:MAG: hypothetical protein PHN93_04600 [Sphaerochaetaceae bacterium]|nr:hypothetical protein [Sphaerochaetaceae bacterium]
MARKIATTVVLLLLISSLHASRPTIHGGLTASVGFFSWYLSADAGIKLDLSEHVAIGLAQRIGYGFTHGEVMGVTDIRTYLYQDLFIHLGISYLLHPSAHIERDFDTEFLPCLGFGLYIPLDREKHVHAMAMTEMNQSFYLSEDIRQIYTDLPFPIAGQIALGLAYRSR